MVTSPLFATLEEPLVTVSLLCGHVRRGRKGSFCGEFPTNCAKIVFLVITPVLGYSEAWIRVEGTTRKGIPFLIVVTVPIRGREACLI
jgi:hypothetical protein